MTILELLAGQLDREPLEHEKKAPESIFIKNIEFWQLCLEAKALLLEEKELNATNKPRRNSKVEN